MPVTSKRRKHPARKPAAPAWPALASDPEAAALQTQVRALIRSNLASIEEAVLTESVNRLRQLFASQETLVGPDLAVALRHGDLASARVARVLSAPGPETAPGILASAIRPNGAKEVVTAASEALVTWARKGRPHLPVLRACLTPKAPWPVRVAVVHALARASTWAPETQAWIADMLDDAETHEAGPEVRREVAKALGVIATWTPATIGILVGRGLRDRNANVQWATRRALGPRAGEPAVRAALETAKRQGRTAKERNVVRHLLKGQVDP